MLNNMLERAKKFMRDSLQILVQQKELAFQRIKPFLMNIKRGNHDSLRLIGNMKLWPLLKLCSSSVFKYKKKIVGWLPEKIKPGNS